jgi:hypothetical protein
MVTTVILPAVRRLGSPRERVELFERIEHRVAWQARITTFEFRSSSSGDS